MSALGLLHGTLHCIRSGSTPFDFWWRERSSNFRVGVGTHFLFPWHCSQLEWISCHHCFTSSSSLGPCILSHSPLLAHVLPKNLLPSLHYITLHFSIIVSFPLPLVVSSPNSHQPPSTRISLLFLSSLSISTHGSSKYVHILYICVVQE